MKARGWQGGARTSCQDYQDASTHGRVSSSETTLPAAATDCARDPGSTQAWTIVRPSSAWALDESALDTSSLEDCFKIPNSALSERFLRSYFTHVHPMLPMLDEGGFWKWKDLGNTTSLSDYEEGDLLLLLIQALLFASSSVSFSSTRFWSCTY